jgi:GTP pyrophosphokinase
VGKIQEAIQARLAEFKVDAQVKGREKHISSIYKKMQEKNISFSEVFDIYGFRIIVPDVPSCYLAMSALHTLYKPIPGKFKDYIAIPKANGYQSLHTTLRPVRHAGRDQIRTWRCTRWPRRGWPRTGCTRARRATRRTCS